MIKTHAVNAKAIERNARASADFEAKLAQTKALLIQGANTYAPQQITQASSLGAEDMVISHLIHGLGLEIGIFVLDTGMLHGETLATVHLDGTVRTWELPARPPAGEPAKPQRP